MDAPNTSHEQDGHVSVEREDRKQGGDGHGTDQSRPQHRHPADPTASRPIKGATISWTSAAGVMNSNAVVIPHWR